MYICSLNGLISSDWLEKLQQAGLRPYLWLEGLILKLRYKWQAGPNIIEWEFISQNEVHMRNEFNIRLNSE
jgi:hypothetical protein